MPYTIAYQWEDLDAAKATGHAEQKFGDHYSLANTLSDAFAETRQYVRSQQGRQKHKFDLGRIVIHQIWDVTDYAKKYNRFGPHKKVDDHIRAAGPLPGRIQADIHRCDAASFTIAVNQVLAKAGQPLPNAALSTYQYRIAEEVLGAFDSGHSVVLAELCARFGKTIWAGVFG